MSPRERADYEAAVSLLILEAYETVDLPLPDDTPGPNDTPGEQERKIAFWTNALLPVVPLDELRPAFDFAVANHKDPRRPVNPIDVKLAHASVLDEWERVRRAESAEDDATDAKRCIYCDEEKMWSWWIPATGETVKAPCFKCRTKAFEQFAEDWHRKNGKKEEAVSLSLVKKAAEKLTLKCDSCGRDVIDSYQQERPCNRVLNAGDNEAPIEFCAGMMKKVHKAECRREGCGQFKIAQLVIVGAACTSCGEVMEPAEA